jgi:hypothetical protein
MTYATNMEVEGYIQQTLITILITCEENKEEVWDCFVLIIKINISDSITILFS